MIRVFSITSLSCGESMPKCVIILALLSIGMLTAAQERPRMIRVSGAVMVGLVEKSALPVYPQLAREKGITGEVIFKILVDETGRIVMTEPVDGDPLLVAASIDALREFRYRPYQLMGSAIKVESQVGFRFANNGKVEQLSSIPNRPGIQNGRVKGKRLVCFMAAKDLRRGASLASRTQWKVGSSVSDNRHRG